MKTIKQQAYHKSRCKQCNGTGVDIFNQVKPCPNCSGQPTLVPSNKLFEECGLCKRQKLVSRGCMYCKDEMEEILEDKMREEFHTQILESEESYD